ncbi:septum site-determining protein Ssd [Nocardia stercoris]|uniref:Rv3660c-like CheY-like N-terminal domain-containing protein n=1 Tax=Nocardia stercoris TaxID=2483361 RepID=A0A3M2KUN6_9NOCA|nr:septum site-determining protein Ssd [Nocardia stercoris]RMI29372.1 hypothetical protein EBN03_26580 [Nocardia stercoris]
MNSAPSPASPALVLLADHRLREEIRRIAAAADRPLDEQPGPVGRPLWAAAELVILDTVSAQQCAAAGLARRPGVLLMTVGEPGLAEWRAAAAVGTDRVYALPQAAEHVIEVFAQRDGRGTGDGLVVAVAGAGGGAGASTLAAAVALTGTGRLRPHTLLVDGDPHGGGLDLLLGIESVAGPRWPDLVIQDGRVAAATLHDALPTAAPGLAVLACARPTGSEAPIEIGTAAVRAVLEAGRAAGDLVVCDVSTQRGRAADQMLDGADLVVLVVPARLRSISAARTAAVHIGRRNPRCRLLVRGPAPGGLHGSEVAAALGLPLLAVVRAQPGLDGDLERGGLRVRRGPLRTAALAVAAELAVAR